MHQVGMPSMTDAVGGGRRVCHVCLGWPKRAANDVEIENQKGFNSIELEHQLGIQIQNAAVPPQGWISGIIGQPFFH